jgi:ADP-ribose pyrophosphatase YjhB (NUDIX family)
MEKNIEKIIKLFLYNNKLKFNEIEKQTGIHSNKLAYYLKKLVKEKILKKENIFYCLNEDSEYLIPYIDSKISALPVILIALIKENKIFLYKRQKKPYKDKLSLPGGRIVLGENLKESVKRIMKKYNISANLKKINSVSLEQIKKKEKIIHTFLLLFISAETKDEIQYYNLEKNKKQIISSDYKLIKNDLNKEIKINGIISRS